MFVQNIDCGYTLEPPPPRRGRSNKYPQSMFWIKNRYTPAYPSFCYIKVRYKGVYIVTRTCYRDGDTKNIKMKNNNVRFSRPFPQNALIYNPIMKYEDEAPKFHFESGAIRASYTDIPLSN